MLSKRSNQSVFRKWFTALAIAAAVVLQPTPVEANPRVLARVIQRLESPIGRALLETREGLALTERLGVAAGDIQAIRARLGQPEMRGLLGELDETVGTIQRRFKARTRRAGRNAAAAVTEAERGVLAELAARELRVDALFLPNGSARSFTQARNMFLRMTEFDTGRAIKRYPRNVDPLVNPDRHLKFGFESEYGLRESGKLLEVYGPAPEFGVSRERWFAMSVEDRMRWVQEHLGAAPEVTRESGLVKYADEAGFDFLPEKLAYDSTGNLEIIVKPADTLEAWELQVRKINERFGVGSMQATVGLHSDSFFGRVAGATEAQISAAAQENLGYLNFINDFDTLQKLQAGAIRYADDTSKEVARSFNHAWLGPMTKLKQDRLRDFIQNNAHGRKFEAHRLEKIRGRDASFKYVGGTSYRPDIAGPNYIVLEIRDAHKNVELLMDNLVRSTFYMQEGRSQFAAMANWQALDTVDDFAKLPENVRSMLREIFPPKYKRGIQYDDDGLLALDVSRNFAYPMRDWSQHVRTLGGGRSLATKVGDAQRSYTNKLAQIERDFRAGTIDKAEASRRVQGAVAEFSIESDLAAAFERFQARATLGNRSYRNYMALVMNEVGPLADAFPSTAWEGPLGHRMARFLDRWRGNAELVDDVKFELRDGGWNAEKGRKVLVISGQGLDDTARAELLRDYLDMISRETVSFPMTNHPGHLYTRMGDKTIEGIGGFGTMSEYYFATGARLEPVVALTPAEELRLRSYFETARTDRSLRNNPPEFGWQGRHNCTSWVCAAPIGEGGTRLMEMLRAQASWNIHVNPGWWGSYLTAVAPSNRVPFVAYWTGETLSSATSAIRAQGRIPGWNWARY